MCVCRSIGALSISRAMAVIVVCAVTAPITRWPESAASSASATSSLVLRSSITSTSGFSRSAVRAAAAIDSTSPRTSRWLIIALRFSWTNLISVSSVMT